MLCIADSGARGSLLIVWICVNYEEKQDKAWETIHPKGIYFQ